jgi:hypothetical protein
MIRPGPDGISQVHWEELDNEKVIVHSARSACEVVVLQPDIGVSFAIVLDGIAQCLKMLWEMSITYDASEHLWARLFRTEVASFVIVAASTPWVSCVMLGLHIIIP